MSKANIDHGSDTESFQSARSRSTSSTRRKRKGDGPSTEATEPKDEDLRLPAEEESALVQESSRLKDSGNSLFGRSAFSDAISIYDRALASLPTYMDYEIAVLRSNISACHLKLQEWKEAVESATLGLDNLERLDPVDPANGKGASKPKTVDPTEPERVVPNDDESRVEELTAASEAALQRLERSGHSLTTVRKLRTKLLLRRARARTEVGGWSSLAGAEEDYKQLLSPTHAGGLSPTDRRTAQGSLAALGPRLEDAKQREMAEMMGKLKGLGNSILKPFGLSTDNFQFVKDEKSGGYSMNFNQGAK